MDTYRIPLSYRYILLGAAPASYIPLSSCYILLSGDLAAVSSWKAITCPIYFKRGSNQPIVPGMLQVRNLFQIANNATLKSPGLHPPSIVILLDKKLEIMPRFKGGRGGALLSDPLEQDALVAAEACCLAEKAGQERGERKSPLKFALCQLSSARVHYSDFRESLNIWSCLNIWPHLDEPEGKRIALVLCCTFKLALLHQCYMEGISTSQVRMCLPVFKCALGSISPHDV